MALRKVYKSDIYRLGVEMRYRGYRVGEHPSFGGVHAAYHIANSKHLRGEAIDLNWNISVPKNAEENRRFDRLALELPRRNFGTIWNRGPGDHDAHLHAETYGYQYAGRVRLKAPVYWRKVSVNGTWDANTTRALQEWLGTPVTGGISSSGSTVIKALQAFLNTEQRGNLVIDGARGPKTYKALQRYLGTPVTGGMSRTGSTMVYEMQRRLNARGHL